MKKNLLRSLSCLLFSIICISSCDKKSDCCTIIDVDVQVHYQTQLGEDLINSSDDFNESNIKIYYKNGDEFEYVFNGNLDYPNMHFVREDSDGKSILTIFPSSYYDGNMSTTLIELKNQTVDTLVCEFDLGSNREVCTNAWLNGVEFANRYLEVKK